MSDLLVDHAKLHVWQEPAQDYQWNMGVGRITPHGGFVGEHRYMWHSFLSPTRNTNRRLYHHIYQIGQISPITLNLVDQLVEDEWYPASKLVNDHNVLIQVYLETGAIIPLSHIWVMRDYSKNITLCIWNDKRIDYGTMSDKAILEMTGKISEPVRLSLDNDKLLVRFYSNSVQHELKFNANSGLPGDTVLTVNSFVTNATDYNLLTHQLTEQLNRINHKGKTLMYIDGFLHTGGNSFDDSFINKQITFVSDETMQYVREFQLRNLPVFRSDRDLNRNKYFLLFDRDYDYIDYFDDMDIYLLNTELKKGVLVSRVHEYHIRQVTHNSIAVDAETIRWYLLVHDWLADIDKCSLLVYVRTGGMVEEVLPIKYRIDELFRLPYQDIQTILHSVDSSLPEWNARELENSDYTRLMGAKLEEITSELVTKAYGYSAMIQAICPPIHTLKADGTITLPEFMSVRPKGSRYPERSIFCYDETGKYLGHYVNTVRETIIDPRPNFKDTKVIECFRLKTVSNDSPCGLIYNTDFTGWDLEDYGYNCYICPIVDGIPSEEWVDVTGKPYYTFSKSKGKTPPSLVWDRDKLSQANQACLIKINRYILLNTFLFTKKDYHGYWSFDISAKYNWNGDEILKRIKVPFGTVEVFANGSSLIEDIDYYMNYPRIVITNAKVNALSEVTLVVRCMGSGNTKTSKPFKPTDIGFIKEGFISVDKQYDIGKHRPNKLVINARMVDKTKYQFSEYTDTGIKYQPDGRPFMVMDYMLPVEHFSTVTTNQVYEEMLEIDRRLGDYLTTRIPDPEIKYPRVITERWMLISPVVCKLLHVIASGGLKQVNNLPDLTISDVYTLMRPYMWLLEYDPAYNDADYDYTYILPHPFDRAMTVSIKQYQFLESVIDVFLKGRIDLTNLVIIGK